MAQSLPLPPPGFDELTPEEKIRYVSALWDRIAEDESSVPVTEEQRQLVRERLAEHWANPEAAEPWSEVRREIEARARKRFR